MSVDEVSAETDRRRLTRVCVDLLRDLEVPVPLDVADLCRRVGDRRGRAIRLVAHPIAMPGPFGCWIAAASTDYIVYQELTTKVHQDHIVLHELGHMICGHRREADDEPSDTASASDLGRLLPDLDPRAVRRALARSAYDSRREWEAETFATIMSELTTCREGTHVSHAGEDAVGLGEALLHAPVHPARGGRPGSPGRPSR